MDKLKIFLADLEHNYKSSPQNSIPYAVGLIASYAKKIYGDKIDIRLFKDPNKLYEALNKEHCDILGCSTYIWNSNLSHWACRVAKKNNSKLITVLGGPDFAKMKDLKIKYFKKYDYVDIRVAFEGEIAFSNVIKTVLEHGTANRNKIFSNKINGCVYLDKKTGELVDTKQERMHSLTLIPSPYTTGLLDEFFDGHLSPTLQTSRGCPFKCNFCHEADDYFAKIKTLELEYVLEDLEYIAKKMHETKNVSYFILADSNFGMLKRDKVIAEKILEVRKKYNWPQNIALSGGKNERVVDTIWGLAGLCEFTMSVQSMNNNVLEATGRTNIGKDKYKKMAKVFRDGGRTTIAETLVPLPKETLKSFFEGHKELIEYQIQRITSTNLIFLNGTIYEDKKYIEKYGYRSKVRLLTTQFGIYGGEKIFEMEEVAVATNSLSFDDYKETRKFTFLTEILYNSKIMRELEFFLEDYKLSYFDYMYYIYKEIKNAPQGVKDVMQSLEKLTISELKNNEEDLIKYYSKEENFKKLEDGQEGNNLKFLHKTLLLSNKYKDIWLEFVFDCLKKFLEKNNIQINEDFYDIKTFTKAKYDGVLDQSKTNVPISDSFNCDVITWLNQNDRTKSLKDFIKKDKIKIKFSYHAHQINKREYLFKKISNDDKLDLCDFVMGIKPQHNLLRNYEYVEPISFS